MNILNILFLTWNVGHPSPIPAFSADFDKIKSNRSDLIIINLQEIDKRSHIFNGQCEKSMNTYKHIIQKEFSNYSLLNSYNFQSLALFILIRKNTQFQGINNQTVNFIKHKSDGKSSIIYGFSINNKSFSIIGNHFQHDAENFDERNLEWLTVTYDLLFEADFVVLLGDLNYRIELSYEKVIKRISQKNFDRLLRSDQLKKAQRIFPLLNLFKEPIINFQPTYKFDLNSSSYDTSHKKRTPSYTDRILVATFKNNSLPKASVYDVVNSLQSDHRPVFAVYDFFV